MSIATAIAGLGLGRRRSSGRGGRRTRGGRASQRRRTVRSGRRSPSRRSSARGATTFTGWKAAFAVAALAAVVAAGFTSGAFQADADPQSDAALRIVYTAQTAEDAPSQLPEPLKATLRQVGLDQGSIALTRVDGDGGVTSSTIDLTARIDDKPNSPALIPERALPVIDQKIADLETAINAGKATTGGRALFTGLTRISFTGVPTYLLSSGLDLSDPLSFPKLNWTTSVPKIVANVKDAGELPRIQGPVVFVITPTSGAQEQVRAKHAVYRNEVWRSTLMEAGATSVTFIDAVESGPASGPSSPPVPLSEVPDTPIEPVPDPVAPDKKATCTVPTAFFIVNQPKLINEGKTVDALGPCIADALAAGATFEIDAWTSYDGRLDAKGKPAVDSPKNRSLSDARARTIADILTQKLGVKRDDITALRGNGNVDQPHPDPGSPENRRVVVTYTIK